MKDRFLKIRELFDAAREISDPTERARWLEEHTQEDASLRQEVSVLLQRHEGLGGNVEAPPQTAMKAVAEGAFARTESGDLGRPRTPVIGGYVLGDVLGKGGMATVFRARQSDPERDVALKVLRFGVADEVGIARFRQEAEVLGRLRHEGIAQVHEFGTMETEDGERWFIAMELVEGRPLNTYAAAEGLGLDARIDLLLQVLDAVADAHRQGVVHRDLKPANILVNERGRAKLLDFGVARVMDEGAAMTRTGDMVGTLLYMSPEQASGGIVDTRCDIYSVGLIAYELISGRPCRDKNLGAAPLLAEIRADSIPPLARVAERAPVDLCYIVDKALAHSADRRYPTADAFADDLRRFQRYEAVLARAPTWDYQLGRFLSRNRPLVVGALAVLLALAVGLALALRSGRLADEERRRASALALARLNTANMLSIQSALTDIQQDRPRLAARRLARVAVEDRTWIWDHVSTELDQTADHVEGEVLTATDVGRGEVDATVFRLDEAGRLLPAAEVLRLALTPQELESGASGAWPRPVVIRSGELLLPPLRRTNLESKPPQVLPARGTVPSLRVWTGGNSLGLENAETGERLPTALLNLRPCAVALHPHKPRLLVGTENRSAFVFDLTTRQVRGATLPQGATVTAVAWSEDASRFAAIDRDGTLRVYAAEEARLLATIHARASDIVALQFLPNAETLAGLGASGLWSWLARPDPTRVMSHHAGPRPNFVYGVSVSSDGRWIASAAWDGTVRIASALTGDLLATLPLGEDFATDVAFAGPRRIVVGCGGSVLLLNLASGERVERWESAGRHRRIALHPTGDRVVWRATRPAALMEVVLGAGAEPRQLPLFPQPGPPTREASAWRYETALAYGPQGRRLIQRGVPWLTRDLETGSLLARGTPAPAEDAMPDCDVHPDGKRLVTAGPGSLVGVYDLDTGALLHSLHGHDDQVFAVAIHPGGRIVASGGNDNTIRLWDLEAGGESIVLTGHEFYVHDLAFTPDGKMLISASGDGTVRTWSTVSLRERRASAEAERQRRERLQPRVERLFQELGDAEAVMDAVEAAAFSADVEDRRTARDLVLLHSPAVGR